MNNEGVSYTRTQFKKEFAKLMESASIPSNMSNAEITKRYMELFSFVEPYIPRKLFRFRKCDINSIISFEQNTIPVCAAYKFPDKYDSTVYYDHKTILQRARKAYDQLMPNWLFMLKNNPSAFPSNQMTSKILELIHSSKSDGEIIELIWHDYEKLQYEWEQHITKQEQWPRANKTTKIACFTEAVKSKFMWDNYADGYTGFALEYDFRGWRSLSINNHAVMLFPVIYSSQKMDATEMIDILGAQNYMIYNNVSEDIKRHYAATVPINSLYFQRMYLYKDKAEYSHEKEWRLLDMEDMNSPEANEDYFAINDTNSLKAIYYGPEINSHYKSHLRSIAKQKKIREYDVILDTNNRKYTLKTILLK
ncbi:MAG: DUF2971 domain-containing protein [Bacteroidaceae bacterium]|nr:DUF2971 domain-containing protein [Bacteroidaceae bacterium]